MSQFDVVLKGVMAGYDAQQAQADFAKLFSLDNEKTARLFNAARAVLKSGVDEETANKYIARLSAIGVAAVAEEKIDEVAPARLDEIVPTYEAPSEPATVPAASSPQAAEESAQLFPLVFSGKGFEYFKIWIVNLLLSIVTLGIYSAWAKVRNKQYFYGNTHIADASFEYTAEPVKILKGRIIAFVLYVALVISPRVSLSLYLVVAILFLIFLPWIIVSSLRFNARHTSYRNIPFRFTGTVGGAAKTFLLWPIVGIFSLGMLFPFVWKRQAQYVTNNHSYGSEPFRFDVAIGEYYKVMLFAFIAIGMFGVVLSMIYGSSLLTIIKPGGAIDHDALLGFIPGVIAYIFFYFGIGAYFVVSMVNIHMNNTQLQDHKFQSTWKLFSYLGLLLTNTLGILLTLGLYIPFAKVRTAAYRMEHTALLVSGSMDTFVALERDKTSALGEGVHDMFDIDISF